MKIQLGNYGQTAPGATPRLGVQETGGRTAQALQQIGGTLVGIGLQQMREDEREKYSLARAKAVNETYRHEADLMGVLGDVEEKVRTKQIDYKEAENYYSNKASGIRSAKITDLDPTDSEHFNGIIARNTEKHRQTVKALVKDAEREDFKNQFFSAVDSIGKQAQSPGANIDEINNKYSVAFEMAKLAGLDLAQAGKKIQDEKDNNHYLRATEKVMHADVNEDVAALQQLKNDLTSENGYYVGRMDTSRRNAVLKNVTYSLDRIENRRVMQAARVEARAERALAKFDQTISTGANPSQKAIDEVTAAVSGTQYEGELSKRLQFAEEVQAVLSLPVDRQVELASELTKGAYAGADDAGEVARAERLAGAIQRNIKTMVNNPFQWHENRTGETVERLPLEALADLSQSPRAASAIGEMLQERASLLQAMSSTHGVSVNSNLLHAEEEDTLTKVIKSAPTHTERTAILRAVRAATGDIDTYKRVLMQIAPKAPVTAMAGALATEGVESEYSEGGFFGGPTKYRADVVASTMLKGEDIINGRKFDLPSSKAIGEYAASKIGAAYKNNPDAYQSDILAIRAYYAGAVSEEDSPSKDINPDILDRAINLIAGSSYEAGDTQVLAPFGMNEDDFADALETAWDKQAASANLQGASLDDFGLQAVSDGAYMVLSGSLPLQGKDGKLVILRVR